MPKEEGMEDAFFSIFPDPALEPALSAIISGFLQSKIIFRN
jgi:hypothetical protein